MADLPRSTRTLIQLQYSLPPLIRAYRLEVGVQPEGVTASFGAGMLGPAAS
jgi:hypothetical protein